MSTIIIALTITIPALFVIYLFYFIFFKKNINKQFKIQNTRYYFILYHIKLLLKNINRRKPSLLFHKIPVNMSVWLRKKTKVKGWVPHSRLQKSHTRSTIPFVPLNTPKKRKRIVFIICIIQFKLFF
jgi:hypothetical protein